MAVYQKPKSFERKAPWNLEGEALPPEGTFYATCLDVADRFGVDRPDFNDPSKTVKQDLTWFLFGFRDAAGKPHRVATFEMRISGNEKSKLFKFLKGWMGKAYPYGQDYTMPEAQGGMKGRKALLTINLVNRKSSDGQYAEITSVSPMPAQAAPAAPAPMVPGPSALPPVPPLPVPAVLQAPAAPPLASDAAGDGFRQEDEIPF